MTVTRRGLIAGIAAGMTLAAGIGPALAQRGDEVPRRSGDLVPLRDVIRKIRRRADGDLLDAQYDDRRGRYKVIWRRKNGEIEYYTVDAYTGRILSVRKRREGARW